MAHLKCPQMLRCYEVGQISAASVYTIGRPIANTQSISWISHLQPIPIGVPGELYIGGVGLARGYLNQPELTEKRFYPNPFRDKIGISLFKTGDMGRWLADGNIEFLGSHRSSG